MAGLDTHGGDEVQQRILKLVVRDGGGGDLELLKKGGDVNKLDPIHHPCEQEPSNAIRQSNAI